ncbi:MAG: hypothetical protein U9R73_01665 [Pseudomonadota bacterium]|nr:hypothetical protein [Pseudomonadota bacterium]
MKSLTSALALAAMLLATGAAPAPTSADADAFVAKAEKDLEELGIFAARAAWVNATYITDDTDILAARTGAAFTEAGVRYASEAAKGSVANMGHGRAASPSWGIRQHWRNAY